MAWLRLRDECLNQHWFTRLADAREKIEAWRIDYNTQRPHSSLGYRHRKSSRRPTPSRLGCGEKRRKRTPAQSGFTQGTTRREPHYEWTKNREQTPGAMGYIQFVVDNVKKAQKVLRRKGVSCYEEQVLYVTLPNVPGAVSRFARKLADQDINIRAGHQTTVKGSKKANVVLAVSHIESARRVR